MADDVLSQNASDAINDIGRMRSPDKLQELYDEEQTGKGRATVLAAIEERLEEVQGDGEADGTDGEVEAESAGEAESGDEGTVSPTGEENPALTQDPAAATARRDGEDSEGAVVDDDEELPDYLARTPDGGLQQVAQIPTN